ncbi:hypothetical protein CVT26_001805 [Gymnopilus dilepis]|uniref:DUF6589 domain-containing protein n=1 Tax=Gymnopilus dilepis TaxID=231916 RepID=A0A409Y420_9AGAR|nr:hypothetical protein CVT26_001805 [Gymnopilus dilepis]
MVTSLLDANPSRRRIKPEFQDTQHGDIIDKLSSKEENDLGEIGGDAMNVDTQSDVEMMDVDPQAESDGIEEKKKRSQRRAAERNAALIMIKSVVCISIFLQSTNEKCNYLQSVLGFFYHSTSVPEKVIETLAHAGLSVGLSSIHKGIKALSREAEKKIKASVRTLQTAFAYDNFDISFKTAAPTVEKDTHFVSATSATAVPLYDVVNSSSLRCSEELWNKDPRNPSKLVIPVKFDISILRDLHKERSVLNNHLKINAWHVRDILLNQAVGFKHFVQENGQPATINQIPLHRTSQIPCRAMKIKESTADGNIEVVENLFRQGGIGEPEDQKFLDGIDVDMTEFVILIHGDLLTKERLESVQDSRRIEATPKRRFQFPIFIPGLFHFKMAAADAIWRTWVQPSEARTDPNSLFEHVGILRPKETGKFVSKPGFRRMHDVIHHDIWAAMLDCWRLEAMARNSAWKSLEDFAKAKPNWELIVDMSEAIVRKYVATLPTISKERKKATEDRDQIFENQIIRNRDELLYLELSHAMNAGDIGRVEATFLPWIYMFRATGKHKYSTHMLQFMFNLRHVYSADLAQLIRMNWLCNPTGKPHKFRGVDWMVERNNLYTKVIYGGSGSNRTIDRIVEESVLIELFRECHVTVENGFHLMHRTIRHAPANMVKTLRKLSERIEANSPHVFTRGRAADYIVPDQVAAGIAEIQTTGKFFTKGDGVDEAAEIDEEDLGVD